MFCDCGFHSFLFPNNSTNIKKKLFLTLELAHGENIAVEFMIHLRDFQSYGKVMLKKFIYMQGSKVCYTYTNNIVYRYIVVS